MAHRAASPGVAMRGCVAVLAGLVVTENGRSGPVFAKYTPYEPGLRPDHRLPLAPHVQDGGSVEENDRPSAARVASQRHPEKVE